MAHEPRLKVLIKLSNWSGWEQRNSVVVWVSKIKSKRLLVNFKICSNRGIICWRKENKEEVKLDPIIDPFASGHGLSAAFAMFMVMM